MAETTEVEQDGEEIVEIRTTKPVGKRVPFRIGGELYRFRIPKMHGLIKAVGEIQRIDRNNPVEAVEMFDKIEAWLFNCLPDDQASRIRDRLNDEDDEVDVDHIVEVFKELVARSSGRPSSSRSD